MTKHSTYFIYGSPVGTMVKNLPVNAGDVGDLGSIPGLGRFPGGITGIGNQVIVNGLELVFKTPG